MLICVCVCACFVRLFWDDLTLYRRFVLLPSGPRLFGQCAALAPLHVVVMSSAPHCAHSLLFLCVVMFLVRVVVCAACAVCVCQRYGVRWEES